MKKMKYILSAALTLFVAASCTKEQAQDFQVSEGVDVKAVFEATIEDADTKALLQPSGALKWEEGDQIAVYQYGQYAKNVNRDNTKNIFTSDGTCRFSGTIAGYIPVVEADLSSGADLGRYYAVYPAVNCKSYGVTTGKYTIAVPSTQTGLLSDFKNYAVYLGYVKETIADEFYDKTDATLTFTRPFNMFCMTPVLKFNVPAELGVAKIELSALNADGNNINISGRFSDVRSDAGTQPVPAAASTTITVENGGKILSGDVYVVLAPNANAGSSPHALFKSTAKALVLNLSTATEATAAFKLPLVGDVLAGTIKLLPGLPSTVDWTLKTGPGIASISVNKEKIGEYADRKRILVETENENSQITYRSKSALSDLIPALLNDEYDSVYGIARQSNSTPENYLKFKISTEGYADYTAYACTWILNNEYGFGKKISDDASGMTMPTKGSTYPVDGSYLYNLSFMYDRLLNAESTSKLPQINVNGFFLQPSSSKSNNWVGSLRIKSPASGKAKLFFDCYAGDDSRTLIMSVNGTSTTITSGAKGFQVLKSAEFNISAGDIIELSAGKANLRFDSITLLWEPEVTEAALSTESYSAKTSYGK